ncbi:FG-GAP-like repeat-containing protein [Polaromonas sp. A23]|uniref:FG-GAP-like repeat-containing protein n=1 Tax=Polaromonas sp. A23 TaxID=1944133 RepID=UPI0009865992|nr:FG-GAP-like repeat-containing protein [Polaromonas sp. A23]OOG37305.1 hypothetical protein B0B52_18360 [Polaromonas sp. A23]
MKHPYKQALLGVVLCAAASSPSFAQTTVAGTTPGQFSVNESGAATYSIPIQVPPGVAGMQPQLSLEYNSQGGNGLLGMGWNLSGLSAITRCPRTMAQDGVRGGVNYDMNDRFCLDGQRLILVSGTYGAANSEYRTERESFSKIIAYGTAGNGPAYFTMQTKAGLTMELGNTADSRIEAQGKTTVMVWSLSKIRDVKNNEMSLSYAEDHVNGSFELTTITYGAMNAPNSLNFSYESRSDIQSGYLAGSKVTLPRRLLEIKSFVADTNTPIKNYKFVYEVSAGTHRSRLKTITECDSTGTCLRPAVLAWHDRVTAFEPLVTSSLRADSFAGWITQLLDINGDGRSDLVVTSTGTSGLHVITGLGRGDGTFEPLVTSSLRADSFAGWITQLLDINGDGRSDLVVTSTGTSGLHVITGLGRGDGTFEPLVTNTLRADSFAGWITQLLDINGDGRSDLVVTSTGTSGLHVITGLGRGDGTFEPLVTSTLRADSFAGWITQLLDINGDGRSDLVVTSTGTSGLHVITGLGRGDGTFEPLVTNTLRADSFAGWITQLLDINGDGRSDLVVTSTNSGGLHVISASNTVGVPDVLSGLTSGLAATTSITYRPLTDTTVYTKDVAPNASVYPKIDLQYPQYVVSTVSTSNGVGGVNTVEYNYGGLKAEQGTGRGLLGFRWMKSKSVANNIESYTEFNQNHPFTGTVAKNETRLAGSGNAGLLKRTTNTYAQSPGSAGASVFVYPSQSVEESWDLSGTPYPGSTTSYVYGQSPQYGDPTQITVSNSEGSSKTTVNEYWPADTGSGNWILGRLKKASVTSVKP